MGLDLEKLINDVISLGNKASIAINKVYAEDNFEVVHKEDNSPLTKADMQSHNILTAGLLKLTPGLPVLSEEGGNIDYIVRKTWDRYWLIDPLDGTKEFVGRTGEFTINIALIDKGEAIMGVVMVPQKDECYFAATGLGAFWQQGNNSRQKIFVSELDAKEKIRVTVSRRHGQGGKLDNLLDKLPNYELLSCGSTLKICLIAKGEADLYPRFGKTCEWDTAAGQCVLEQSGGKLLDLAGNRLEYNTKSSIINPEFIAYGCDSLVKLISSMI